jgi:hypothetical protein
MAETTLTYDIGADFQDGVDTDELVAEVRALSLSVEFLGLATEDDGDQTRLCNLIFADAPSPADEAAVDAVVAAHNSPLDQAKKAKIAAIDARTRQLIDAGFEFPPGSGVVFSLSLNSQLTLLGLGTAKDDPAFTYPVDWNSKNDKAKQTIPDAATAGQFFLTALGTVRAHLDAGTALKDAVRAAATVGAVDAVVDPR